jgi:hypothetical protein
MLLGHASVATTERYCAEDDSEIPGGDGSGGTVIAALRLVLDYAGDCHG